MTSTILNLQDSNIVNSS